MRYLISLLLLSGLAVAAAPAAMAQDVPAPPSTVAAPAANPYQATVPVTDTSEKGRNRAFAQALAQVLSRVSGHAVSVDAVGEASTYVQKYQYRHAPADAAQPYLLTVHFAPASVRHLIRGQGAPAPADTGASAATSAAAVPMLGGVEQRLWVSGIGSALDYAGALATLQATPGVDHVAVRQAEDGGMLLDIRTSVPLTRVLASLDGSGRFASSGPAHAGAAASLRWLQ